MNKVVKLPLGDVHGIPILHLCTPMVSMGTGACRNIIRDTHAPPFH